MSEREQELVRQFAIIDGGLLQDEADRMLEEVEESLLVLVY